MIETKWNGASSTITARAVNHGKSARVPYRYELSVVENHDAAARRLIEKLREEPCKEGAMSGPLLRIPLESGYLYVREVAAYKVTL